jgi:hypothetical protein
MYKIELAYLYLFVYKNGGISKKAKKHIPAGKAQIVKSEEYPHF